ncbi:MAG: hypothetical protein U9Q82_16320, partial [Chloroflexota bacterium]|nr:hypothetical protein [Chloroflexota bacterium]
MKLFHRKKKDINLSGMESRIEATLRPVTPRRAFVDDLRSRLMAYSPQPAPVTIINREKEVQRGWLIAGGVVGSLLMLII